MNIFITGHKGLIGDSLKKRLEQEGHKIVGAVDIRDNTWLHQLKDLRSRIKIDMFVHCAAMCKINKSMHQGRLV